MCWQRFAFGPCSQFGLSLGNLQCQWSEIQDGGKEGTTLEFDRHVYGVEEFGSLGMKFGGGNSEINGSFEVEFGWCYVFFYWPFVLGMLRRGCPCCDVFVHSSGVLNFGGIEVWGWNSEEIVWFSEEIKSVSVGESQDKLHESENKLSHSNTQRLNWWWNSKSKKTLLEFRHYLI